METHRPATQNGRIWVLIGNNPQGSVHKVNNKKFNTLNGYYADIGFEKGTYIKKYIYLYMHRIFWKDPQELVTVITSGKKN